MRTTEQQLLLHFMDEETGLGELNWFTQSCMAEQLWTSESSVGLVQENIYLLRALK